MISPSKSLPPEDAKAVVDVLVRMQPGLLANFLDVQMRGALEDCVDFWPGTDWARVSAWLRSEDAWKIADRLDEAVRRRTP